MIRRVGQPYNAIPIVIMARDQFKPEFLNISRNNEIPVLIDSDGPGGEPISMFESAVIMQYLAEKHTRSIPLDSRALWEMKQWLTVQSGHIGPMLEQAHRP